MNLLRRGLLAFGRFWWEFLVGDTPELFVATAVIVALAVTLRHQRLADLTVLLSLAVVALAASTYRGRGRGARPRPHPEVDDDVKS